jgi:hypothetical protein
VQPIFFTPSQPYRNPRSPPGATPRAPAVVPGLRKALPKEGFDLALKLAGPGISKLKVGVYDFTFSLPQVPDFQFAPRPDYLMLAPYTGLSDCTIVGKSFDLPASQ